MSFFRFFIYTYHLNSDFTTSEKKTKTKFDFDCIKWLQFEVNFTARLVVISISYTVELVIITDLLMDLPLIKVMN